ncbi:PspA/IM30 family protein [Leptospirillum ferrooxidans]|jgi:phage shock protein A|uniref:Putative phage shock protein A n=1 Tax=Leptospirillum ferrooxidans (strain C2-3) TaxID=1162668 RepID=I0IQV0_LEPFC|nr:PspA/IM30 family protein [Leptospirillum ferrooxidans]MDA8060054.1 PspA/IM30 family protein [Nitrospiraceae bacterium]BAM07649.1 putative phage shock protein A [Leptospirillum ferrooxidans C2-3]
MSLYERFRTIFLANANTVADHLEDPAAMMAQQMRALDDKLQKAQGELVKAVAEIKLLEQKIRDDESQVALYQERAEKAVKAGNDDLAKRALVEKSRLSADLSEMTRQRDEQQKVVSEIEGDLSKLRDMHDEFARKQSMLSLREERAQASQEVNSIRAEIDPGHLGSEMKRMTDKIDMMEAQAQATREIADRQSGADLDTAFRELDKKSPDIDSELSNLKKTLGAP